MKIGALSGMLRTAPEPHFKPYPAQSLFSSLPLRRVFRIVLCGAKSRVMVETKTSRPASLKSLERKPRHQTLTGQDFFQEAGTNLLWQQKQSNPQR
jgi:hypothetical protein